MVPCINGPGRIVGSIVMTIYNDIYIYTLLGTNISPFKGLFEMIFLFPRWDMLVPWRVYELE